MRKVGVHETSTQGLLAGVQGRRGSVSQSGRQASHGTGARTQRLAPDAISVGSSGRRTQGQAAKRRISRSWQTHSRTSRAGTLATRERTFENGRGDFKKSQGLLREAPPLRFAFVHANRNQYPITRVCCNLDVSKAGYFEWRRRDQRARLKRDGQLVRKIQRVHSDNRGRYGSPRIHVELRASGVKVSGKRVARLMRI